MNDTKAKELISPRPTAANPPLVLRPDYMNSKDRKSASYSTTIAEAASHILSDAGNEAEGPFDLVGYSLGAGVAAFIAAEYPERVRSLVLISGFGYGADVWMKLQFDLWLNLVRTDRTALTRLLLLSGLSRDFLSNFDEGTITGIVDGFVASTDWDNMDHSIQLDLDLDIREHARKIAVPTLSITARHDRIVPEFYSHQLAELTRGAQRSEIDSGHLSFLEQPAQLATTITNFLDSFRI